MKIWNIGKANARIANLMSALGLKRNEDAPHIMNVRKANQRIEELEREAAAKGIRVELSAAPERRNLNVGPQPPYSATESENAKRDSAIVGTRLEIEKLQNEIRELKSQRNLATTPSKPVQLSAEERREKLVTAHSAAFNRTDSANLSTDQLERGLYYSGLSVAGIEFAEATSRWGQPKEITGLARITRLNQQAAIDAALAPKPQAKEQFPHLHGLAKVQAIFEAETKQQKGKK